LIKQKHVVIIPTAGSDPDNPWLPDERGRLRIDAAAAVLNRHPEALGLIIGRYATPHGVSLALRMLADIRCSHPRNFLQVRAVDGRTNNAVDDLKGGLPLLVGHGEEAQTRLTLVTHRIHFNRVEPTLLALGYRHVMHEDSGEDTTIYGRKDSALQWITDRDPLWQGGLAVLARLVTTLVAYVERRRHAAWAAQHFEKDKEEHARVISVATAFASSGGILLPFLQSR
jgi:hypothetical protein